MLLLLIFGGIGAEVRSEAATAAAKSEAKSGEVAR
jgi:hypothetical protein